MDYNIEYLKKLIEQKCTRFSDSEKIYVLNKVTNALRGVKTCNLNGFNMSTLNPDSVIGRYKETLYLTTGKIVTFGFDYD